MVVSGLYASPVNSCAGYVKACVRCVTTTSDRTTAARGAEPLATLARCRRGARGVLFGQNLIHRVQGEFRIGDTVRVLARRSRSELAP